MAFSHSIGLAHGFVLCFNSILPLFSIDINVFYCGSDCYEKESLLRPFGNGCSDLKRFDGLSFAFDRADRQLFAGMAFRHGIDKRAADDYSAIGSLRRK